MRLVSVEGPVMLLVWLDLRAQDTSHSLHRQLHTRLNEAYPTVWREVCLGVSVGFSVFFSTSIKC